MGCGALLHSAFSPGALSFYELKEGRAHALVRLVLKVLSPRIPMLSLNYENQSIALKTLCLHFLVTIDFSFRKKSPTDQDM